MPRYTVNWPLKMGGKLFEAGETITANEEDVADLLGGVLSSPPATAADDATPDEGGKGSDGGLTEEQEAALRDHLAGLPEGEKPTVKDLAEALKFTVKAADRDRVLAALKPE